MSPWSLIRGKARERRLRRVELSPGPPPDASLYDCDGFLLSYDETFGTRRWDLAPKPRPARRQFIESISRELAQALWTLRKERHAADEELVWISHAGLRVDQSNVMSRVLKPAARKAGIGDWPGFHAFRHTAATRLFRRGWNAVQVQRFLGHSDPGFTLRTYVHLLPDDLPEPICGGSTSVSTSPAETGRNGDDAQGAIPLQIPASPNRAEVAAFNS